MSRLINFLVEKRMVLGLLGVFAFSLAVTPVALGQTDPFGLVPVRGELETTLGNRDLRETTAAIINVALSLLGIVAVVIVLIGGFQWMTAGGNEDKIGSAKKTIFAGIIGMAIIMSSWAIAQFVLNSLLSATTGGTP